MTKYQLNIRNMHILTRITISLTIIILTIAATNIPNKSYAAKNNQKAANQLPYFAALRSDESNMRTGPGTRYPVIWVYKRKGLPLEIIDKYKNWRKVRDITGEIGWMHKSLLTGRRNAIIINGVQTIYRNPDKNSPPYVQLEENVNVKIIRCKKSWCQVEYKNETENYKGWIEKVNIWGVYPDEIF